MIIIFRSEAIDFFICIKTEFLPGFILLNRQLRKALSLITVETGRWKCFFLGSGLGISADEFDRALTRLYMTWQGGIGRFRDALFLFFFKAI